MNTFLTKTSTSIAPRIAAIFLWSMAMIACGGQPTEDVLATNPAVVTISPTSATVAVTNLVTFSASSGTAPYSFSVVTGSGSIDATTGVYTAGITAGSAIVRVTDANGTISEALVTVNAALSISPNTKNLLVSGSQTFAASGGIPPRVFSILSGGGNINSSSGAYVGPASAGSALIRVTDALGNTANANVTIADNVAVSPATSNLVRNGTSTFSATGGFSPFVFSVVSGGGSINSASGAFTAPATAGSVVVRATDSQGFFANATVTVVSAPVISPSTAVLAVNNSRTFSASGGLAPYSYSIHAGNGSVNPSSGAYTAPASAGTDTVRVTDALGQTSDAVVTINPALSISPLTPTAAINSSVNFSAAGGVAPYTYSITAGSGSVNSSTGVFTAPSGAGSTTVRVTDALGNTAATSVTIVPVTTIAPATVTLAVNNSVTFSASGGSAPYAYAVQSGGGSVDPSTGVYTAPATSGSATVRVTDSIGQTSDAVVTINPALAISPVSSTVTYNASINFSASGGVGPFGFAIATGVGSINSSSGLYSAPASAGSATIEVTDSLGNSASAAVAVVDPIVISPSSATLAVNNFTTFSATGGSAPYTFSVFAGGGSVDPATGAYTAPSSAGSATVRVTDAIGQTSDASITINAALAISPSALNLLVSGSHTFTATGGVSPYAYSILSGGGNINPSSGAFVGPITAGSVVVRVTDSLGNTSDANVAVADDVLLSPGNPSLAISGSANFSSTGGFPPYVYTITSGGGSIDPLSGAFTAPGSIGSVVIRSTDSEGFFDESTVTVIPMVTISPASKTLAVNNTQTFTASGGSAPYTYSVFSGGGSVNPSTGVYTAPASAGLATVRVTDAIGQTSDAAVTINPALSISPATLNILVSGTQTFTASGGVSPYSFSIFSGDGNINSSSGAFVGPATAGSVVVRVTDALGNTSNANVTVANDILLSPTTLNIAMSGSATFSTTGGFSPYIYSISSGGGSINPATGVFTAPSSTGSVVVRSTDAQGFFDESTVTVVSAVNISPATKQLAVNNTATFTASGGVAPYGYTMFSGGGSVNSSTGVYTAPASAGSATVRVTDAIGQVSNAVITINPALAISPATQTIATNATLNFSATGGVSPYTYSITSGGGSINPSSGVFTAPSAAGSVAVRVTDSLGNISNSAITVAPTLSISPASKTLAVNNTQTFTASGGSAPYTYSVFSGGGSVNPSTGVYTAPASAGLATVRVTDAIGQTANATVSINSALIIAPNALAMYVNGNQTISASGGVSPYTYSITAGGGSINLSTGSFTAPGTAQSVTVQVTDTLSNTSSATITVVNPLVISPASINLQTDQPNTFSATGGQTPYTYSILSGGGTIDPLTGDFIAPNSPDVVGVRVTDSLGFTSDAAVTVYAPIVISPATITLGPNNAITFTVTGGLGDITFSIFSGGGSIDPISGDFVAPSSAGTVVVRATDTIGNFSSSTVTVNDALTISPTTFKLSIGQTKTFTATGGVPPRVFSIEAGNATINSSTGIMTAGGSSSIVTVRVTDALSNIAESTVTVVSPLSMASGGDNSCVIYSDGSMRCFGDAGYGQLGEGVTTDRGDSANEMGSNLAFINLGTGRTVKSVSIGSTHICAVLDNNNVKCWGRNNRGQLGYGDVNNRGDTANEMGDNLPNVSLGTGRTAKSVYAGVESTCAILDDNSVKCWGYNNYGQLGQGNVLTKGDGAGEMGDSLPVTTLGTGRYAVSIAMNGVSSTCALLDNNSVKCWGRANYGQLGYGNTTTRGDGANEMGDFLPVVNLGTGRTALQLVGGNVHYCALLDNNSVKCWGRGSSGQLGNGSSTINLGDAANEMGDLLAAIPLGTGLTPSKLYSNNLSNCVLFTDDSVKCWGINTTGALGQGNTTTRGDTANEMGDFLAFTPLGTGFTPASLSLGIYSGCAFSTTGKVKCWGRATNGNLGNASTTNHRGDAANEMGDFLSLVDL